MSLYTELVEAGAEIDNHESDLYVRDTPEVREIVRRSGYRAAGAFLSNGQPWLDVPFAFDPWWEARAGNGEAR